MKRYLLLAAATMVLAVPAHATVLLNTGAPTNTTFRNAGDGPGQFVQVGTATTLNRIGFYTASPSGGQVKYMIWDETNTNLLFSTTATVAASASAPALLFSPTFNFALAAGSSYYFGVISDSALNVGFTFPISMVTQNGLTATGPNSNYVNFASPVSIGNAGASINLVLDGTQGAVVPEPASWALMIGGFGMVGGAMRRRKVSAKVSFA